MVFLLLASEGFFALWTGGMGKGTHLLEVTILGLVVKHVEEGPVACSGGVHVGGQDDRRHHLRVGQRLQRLIAQVDGMLHWTLPVRVLVEDGCQDLGAVVPADRHT